MRKIECRRTNDSCHCVRFHFVSTAAMVVMCLATACSVQKWNFEMAQSILVQVSAEWANPIKSFDAMSSPEEVKIRFGIYPAYRAWFACVWLVCGDWRGCAVVLTVVLEQRRKLSTIPGTESTTTATTTTATTVTTCQRSRPCLGHWSQPTNTHTHTHKETRSCWPNTTNAT